MTEDTQFTEMQVHRLVLDPNTNSPIVILREEATGVMLPIWIGLFEAHAIATKLENMEPPRPMTHDLLHNVIQVVKGMVQRIEVVDLVDNTYFARIHIQTVDTSVIIDSRPSDAIALSLRAPAPIFVANHVLEQSKIDPLEEDGSHDEMSEEERWTRILKGFEPPGPDKAN